MKQRFRMYRRSRGGRFYIHDSSTGKQESLGTTDRKEALRLLHAKNEADRNSAVSVQIARAYLTVGDPKIGTRTWHMLMDEVIKTKRGNTRQRWERAIEQKAFGMLRPLPILQTRPEDFLHVLEAGTVSTNNYLRRLHSFALALSWLPWPILKPRTPMLDFVWPMFFWLPLTGRYPQFCPPFSNKFWLLILAIHSVRKFLRGKIRMLRGQGI